MSHSRRNWLIGMASMGGTIALGSLPDRPSQALEIDNFPQKSHLKPQLQSFAFAVAKLDGQGEVVRTEPGHARKFTENLGHNVLLEMVAVPAGEFLMGAPETEAGSRAVERPQQLVRVPKFFLGRYPVTQAQWQAVMGKNPAQFRGDNLPVEMVSWSEAMDFCTKLATLTGKPYRLPAETEWEYACRAGSTTAFHWGEAASSAVANYRGEFVYGHGQQGEYRGQTTAVDQFPANAFGLNDMHGNVWEWCADRWHEDYRGLPTNGQTWTAGESEFRVLRGGSWLGHPHNFRSACRFGDGFDPDFAHNTIGLRVCLGAV